MKKITFLSFFIFLTIQHITSQNIWDGDSVMPTGLFTDNSNWSPDFVPITWNASTDLEITNNNGNQLAIDYNFTNWVVTNSIIYKNTFIPSPFIINSILELKSSTNKGIIFNGKIGNYSIQTQKLNLKLGFDGSSAIKLNPVNGNLIFSNTLFNPSNNNYEVFGNNHKKLLITGDLQGFGSKLTIRGESTVVINNNYNSFGGGINVKKGELWLETNAVIAGNIKVGAGNIKNKKVYISNPITSTTIPNDIIIPNGSKHVTIGAFNNLNTHEFAGRIKINNNNASPVLFDEINPDGTLILSGKITSNPFGTGIFKKIGAGKIIINNNANTFSGLTKINDGKLQLGDGGATGKINGNIENNADFIFNRSANKTFTHDIFGSGNITKLGSNSLRVTSSITCTGSTTVSNGIFVIANTCIFISGQLTVKNGAELWVKSNNAEILDLVIEAGGKVIVFPNTTLTITNGIINDGLLNVHNKGSLVQINNSATNTGSGIYKTSVKINPIPTNAINPSQSSRYTYFSSPTQGKILNVFNSWGEMASLYSFDSSIQNWQSKTSASNMLKGIGYIVRNKEIASSYPFDGSTAAKGLTIFTGAFNNGVSTHTLTFNAGGSDDDSTLLGNPYPSAISTTKIFNDNSSVFALHFWRHAQGADVDGNFNEQYAVKTLSGSTFGAPTNISTGQGFFVIAGSTGALTFKNDMRINGNNNSFLRPSPLNLDKAWFNLTTPNGIEAQVLVSFIPNCTDNFDSQYDAHNMYSGSYLSLYTNGSGTDAQNLAIQARAPLNNQNSTIPLGFEMTNTNITSLTLSLDHFEQFNGYDILLRDNNLNIIHDLKQSDYNFTVNQIGNFNSRFDILFNRNTLSTNDEIKSSNNLIISNSNNSEIKVSLNSKNLITNIKSYDVMGKLLFNITPNKNSFVINSNIKIGSVLFLKATLDNGQVISRKFIKN